MFQPGDLIIYGRTVVCRVEAIEEKDDRQYYCPGPYVNASIGCFASKPRGAIPPAAEPS